ncbi:MAG TPA: hypothetical protein VIG30_11090 [Ktedonobacterales bacterium]|jgi:hypothetical protein
MFPIAHVWLLERVVAAPTPAHYLGCVWPDMLFGSPLGHVESHQRGAELLAFARARQRREAPGSEELLAFVTGALSHGSQPHGFDWYSDEAWGGQPPEAKGYAFQRGLPLADATAAACRLAPEFGAWKAHNIVEMAFEVPLHTADPRLGERFVAAGRDAALVARIAGPLGEFFGKPAEALAAAMTIFARYWVVPDAVATLAHIYALQVRAKHQVPDPDEAAIAGLIARATDLIAPDRDAYLAACVQEVGAMLRAMGV